MALRILADENVARDVVEALREAGHDVAWASDFEAQRSDEFWLQVAEDNSRLLLTNDKDFGDLVFRDRRRSTVGVILLRIGEMKPGLQAALLLREFDGDLRWDGRFTVVGARRLRQVRLPDMR